MMYLRTCPPVVGLILLLGGCGDSGPGDTASDTESTSGASTTTSPGDGSTQSDPSDCKVGDETCSCYPNGTCNGTLTCVADVCVDTGTTSGSSSTSGATEASSTSGTSSGTSASEGSTGGSEGDTGGTSSSSTESSGTDGSSTSAESSGTDGSSTSAESSGTDGSSTSGSSGTGADMICEPDTAECNDEVLVTCNAEGTAWTSQPCDGGLGCNPEASACQSFVVAPGAEGWVSRFENALGVQGAWFTYFDEEQGSEITSDPTEWSEGELEMCLAGTVLVGVAGDTPPTGAFNLCQIDAEQAEEGEYVEGQMLSIAECPNPRLGEMRGVRFTIAGTEVPQYLDVLASTALGQIFPVARVGTFGISTPQTFTVRFATDFEPPAPLAQVVGLHFQVPVNDPTYYPGDTYDFDFCLSAIRPVL